MDKSKIKLIATGILIVIFILILANNFRRNRPAKLKKGNHPSSETAAPSLTSYDAMDEKFAKIGWRRDPFRLVTQKQAAAASYLQGIVWGPDYPVALFGGKFLKIGDKVEGYKIMDIKRKSVILTNGESVYELGLGESLDNLE